MKFTVGDKIKIINAGSGAYGANGSIGVVTNEPSEHGLSRLDCGFNVKILDTDEVWKVSVNGEYEVLSYHRRKRISGAECVLFTFDGNKTTAKLTENNKVGETIKSKEDENDDKIAMIISLAKALELEKDKIDGIVEVLFDKVKEKEIKDFTNYELKRELVRRIKSSELSF